MKKSLSIFYDDIYSFKNIPNKILFESYITQKNQFLTGNEFDYYLLFINKRNMFRVQHTILNNTEC